MAQEHVTLEQAIEMARRLGPAERVKLRRALDQMTTERTGEPSETMFRQVLLEKGMISDIRPAQRITDITKRHPVRVKGKPVSETIIEDRG